MKWTMFSKDDPVECREPHPDEHNWLGILIDVVVATSIIMIAVTAIAALILWL